MRTARALTLVLAAALLPPLTLACGDGDSSDDLLELPGPTPNPHTDENTQPDPATPPATDSDAGTPDEPSTDEPDAGDTTPDAGTTTTACKKHLTVDFAVYTYLTPDIPTNGCWKPVRVVQDPTWRECHFPGTIKSHTTGTHWAYDDTDARHKAASETAGVNACRDGATTGYEYMAYRDDRWRLVRNGSVAGYFAELYMDGNHIDSLYFDGVWKHLVASAGTATAKHIYPMINVGVATSRYPLKTVGREVSRMCSIVKTGGHLGLYAGSKFPMRTGDDRLTAIAKALDACTAK